VTRSTHTASALLAVLCAGLALAGCGGASRQAGDLSLSPLAEPARSAGDPASGGDPAEPARFFSPTSVWNRPLSPADPLDPHSSELVAALVRVLAREQVDRSGPWINTTSESVPILTVSARQATVRVQLDHAPDTALSSAWSAVPLPAWARPASGSDGYLVLWQPSTNRMWEFWRLVHTGAGWSASWGGAMRDVSSNPGVYGPEAWPGAKPWWGATASSLALAGGVMTIEELRRGQIDHALAIAVPDVRAGVFAAPARRTDGSSAEPTALPEGAHLRLDPNLNLSSLRMPALTRMMALAAQRYGIVVRDYSPNLAFFAQDPVLTGANPYVGSGGFFAGEYPSQLLASFPWSHLQVLQMDLHENP
jgi:hypothetical protein